MAEHQLKRNLGFWEVTLSGVGVILGAGIYALIGKAAGMAGNGIWLSFIIAAIVAGITGLSYAELSSRYPRAGGEYEYSRRAFGKFPSFLVGWIILIGGVFSVSTVAIGFGGYFSAVFGGAFLLPALVLIVLCTLVLMMGVKESARAAVAFTLIEVFGLIMIISIGLPSFGSVNLLKIPDISGVLGAAALVFFAYIGFEQISRLAEETRNPRRNIPRAMMLALVITTVLYILVSIASVSVLEPARLGASEAPLAEVASVGLGSGAFTTLAVIALFSTANTVLLFLLAASRILFGMGRGGALPAIFGRVHRKRRTPWAATIILALLALVAVLPGGIKFAASMTNYSVFVTFIAINLAVIFLRRRQARMPGTFRVPLSWGKLPIPPVVGVIASLGLLLNVGLDIIILGTLMLLSGAVVYWVVGKIRQP